MTKLKPTNPAKITLRNIKRYIQGWMRFILFRYFNADGKDLKLLRHHEVEQFKWRLQVMNPECLKNEKCVICGCQTPQLQMCGEACEGGCYPDMMNKPNWEKYKAENQIII